MWVFSNQNKWEKKSCHSLFKLKINNCKWETISSVKFAKEKKKDWKIANKQNQIWIQSPIINQHSAPYQTCIVKSCVSKVWPIIIKIPWRCNVRAISTSMTWCSWSCDLGVCNSCNCQQNNQSCSHLKKKNFRFYVSLFMETNQWNKRKPSDTVHNSSIQTILNKKKCKPISNRSKDKSKRNELQERNFLILILMVVWLWEVEIVILVWLLEIIRFVPTKIQKRKKKTNFRIKKKQFPI